MDEAVGDRPNSDTIAASGKPGRFTAFLVVIGRPDLTNSRASITESW